MTTALRYDDRKVRKRLQTLGRRAYEKCLTRALGKAANVIARAQRASAREHADPKRTEGKHLYQTITRVTRKYRKDLKQVTPVGPRKGEAPHEHLLEMGHRMVVGGTVQRIATMQAASPSKGGQRGKGRVVGFVRGIHWAENAFERSKNEAKSTLERQIARDFFRIVPKD